MAVKHKGKRAKVRMLVHEGETAPVKETQSAAVALPAAVPKHVKSAVEQRNWLRAKAGWPVLREPKNK